MTPYVTWGMEAKNRPKKCVEHYSSEDDFFIFRIFMIFIIPMSMLFDILDFLRLRINILIASLGPSIGSHEERVR